MNTPLFTYSKEEMRSLIESLGEPSFKAKQLYEWTYQKGAQSYDEMTNLSKDLRARLFVEAPLIPSECVSRRISHDGTRKYVFKLHDGALIETVAIPSRSSQNRLTVCFSTQVGCAMGCIFCATGQEGFSRNLTVGEIVSQIFDVQRDMQMRVSNLVGMGQGEPFFNYDNVLDALRVCNDPKGLNIGARHITLSTCGVIPGINRFASEPEQFTLAVSLHSADQKIRNTIMPKAKLFTLKSLKQSLLSYTDATNRRVTLEYLLISGVNDKASDKEKLLAFCDDLLCHINLIPMNDIPDSPFKPTSRKVIDSWQSFFNNHGIETTLRNSRGSDIDGACGQLKNSLLNR